MVVLLMLSALNCSVKQRTVVQAECRGDKIIPYIYYIYEFISYAEAQPTEAEKEIAPGNPRQVKRTLMGV